MRLMERQNRQRDKLTRAVAVIVAGLRSSGDPDAAIRQKVRDAFREALTGEQEWAKDLPLPGRQEPELCLSTAGIFRTIFEAEGIDRGDQARQETLVGVVDRATEHELARR